MGQLFKDSGGKATNGSEKLNSWSTTKPVVSLQFFLFQYFLDSAQPETWKVARTERTIQEKLSGSDSRSG